MWALIVATWRERLLRPAVGILCLVFGATQVTMAEMSAELADPTFVFTLLIVAGSIGKDVTSGVLPLLFTRPVIRSRYVLAKWLSVGAAVAVLSGLTLVIEALFLARAGKALPVGEVAGAIFRSATAAFGGASVLVLLSVLVSGFSDALLWIGLGALPFLLHKYIPQRVSDEWHAFLNPELDWSATFGPSVAWFPLFSYLSTVTLCLCLAALAANRKELSYASSG
jgi:ABC-type transport system involved in multi-copper enzyme maturation permease subunit